MKNQLIRKTLTASCLVFPIALSACSSEKSHSFSVLSLPHKKNYQLAFGTTEGLTPPQQQELKNQFNALASSYNIGMSKNDKTSILRSYFSIENDERNTVIIYYVFDVLDNNGQRLHRVSGNMHTNNIISSNDFNKIAQNALIQLKHWRDQDD